MFTWSRFDAAFDIRVQVRPRSAAGLLGTIQTVSPPASDGNFPRVAVDPDGDAVLAWTRVEGGLDGIQGRALSSSGALSPVLNITGTPAFDQQVAVDSSGNAVFSWRRYAPSNPDRVQARTRSAATGTLSPIATLSAGGEDVSAPRLAVNPAGDAGVSWDRSDGANSRIQAAFGP